MIRYNKVLQYRKVQRYDVCNMVMRSNIVMMDAAWCNTIIGDGDTLENQWKQHVFN